MLVSTVMLMVGVVSALPEAAREGRFFRHPYTSTQVMARMVTSLVPSSCVQVEASLPPCRNVRKLEHFPRFLGGRVYGSAFNTTIDKSDHALEPAIHTTNLGWGEYLGFYAPTVTVVAEHMETTTVLDPRTVVTFSVKGCKPSKLPMDLHLCPTPPDIKPSPTASQIIQTTVIAPVTTSIAYEINPVQSTENQPIVSTESTQPTEKLS